MNVNEIAKQTLLLLKERGLKPTPQNYLEVFEELSSKLGLSGGTKEKIEKYKNLLMPYYQNELKNRPIKSIDEFLSLLISKLNRQANENKNDFFELLKAILKALLVSKDKKVKDMASMSLSRISKAMDEENTFLLEKKWQEMQKNYEDEELNEKLQSHGIKNEDFSTSIQKLLNLLESRSLSHFARLIAQTLQPSLTSSLFTQEFEKKLLSKPYILGESDFKNSLLNALSKRIAADMMFVQKNLNFFDQNLHKLDQMLSLLQSLNQENLDLAHSLPQKDGQVSISFELLKDKFMALNQKIEAINEQIRQTGDEENREKFSLSTQIAKLDEAFFAHNINYTLCVFSLSNYHFIMEKYGLNNLNEIFSRFKKILQDHCGEFDDLWMLDEKSYLIILRAKTYEKSVAFLQENINAIENYKFTYKQEVVVPRVQSFLMDKKSYPHLNLLDEIIKKMQQQISDE